MKVIIKNADNVREFNDQNTIIIGNNDRCDILLDNLMVNTTVKLIYSEKYNNYVLINSSKNEKVLCNGKSFSKALVPPFFSLEIEKYTLLITLDELSENANSNGNVMAYEQVKSKRKIVDIFNNQTEKNRIAIVKEIGNKIEELKSAVRTLTNTSLFLNFGMAILSVICAFGMTNFLLGLKVDSGTSVLNITTNFGFLVCLSAVVLSIALILKYGVYAIVEFDKNKKLGDSNIAHKFIILLSSIFMFMVYVINLFYYKDIPGFGSASFFISILFVGALTAVSVASGYFRSELKSKVNELTDSEFREDFETILKQYRILIDNYVNSLSQNRIAAIRGVLLNNQMRMIMETGLGILTAPFLAYGVSNTLAMCFPEAANWVRISGLRFSPIFLVLATFLIIFAFFIFVSAFTISKEIKGSEIIKFDGFHDYNSHGVTILGIDSTKSLNRERITLLFIAYSIILIEFTMNVSYFVMEIGGNIQGMFLSFVTALVPTALLIAETNLLSNTMFRINNYNELLAMLD